MTATELYQPHALVHLRPSSAGQRSHGGRDSNPPPTPKSTPYPFLCNYHARKTLEYQVRAAVCQVGSRPTDSGMSPFTRAKRSGRVEAQRGPLYCNQLLPDAYQKICVM